MKRRVLAVLLIMLLCLLPAGCRGREKPETPENSVLKAGLVVDRQQIKADPFQYFTWKGLENFKKRYGNAEIKYMESESENAYLPNLDRLADEGCHLIFGSGFLLSDAMKEAAALNRDVSYVLMDYTFDAEERADNLTGIDFASEISAFLVGYIAGNVTETNKVGFVGGIPSAPLDRFEYGFRYGVAYAAKETGKDIQVEAQYTGTFEEAMAGRDAATAMYERDCDVIFQAAGQSGLGVIEAAKLMDRWVIGVDVDQYEEAPDNILTSALKHVDEAVEQVAAQYAGDGRIGGKNYMYGLEEDAVGIPEKNPNLTSRYPGLYDKAMELEQQIKSGKLIIPGDKKSFEELSGKL